MRYLWLLLLLSCTQYVYIPSTVAMYEHSDYTTYAGDAFKRTHFGDLYDAVDTVHVLSITVKDGALKVKTIEHGFIDIKYPDRLEMICN